MLKHEYERTFLIDFFVYILIPDNTFLSDLLTSGLKLRLDQADHLTMRLQKLICRSKNLRQRDE